MPDTYKIMFGKARKQQSIPIKSEYQGRVLDALLYQNNTTIYTPDAIWEADARALQRAYNATQFTTGTKTPKQKHCSSCAAPIKLDRQNCDYCGTIY